MDLHALVTLKGLGTTTVAVVFPSPSVMLAAGENVTPVTLVPKVTLKPSTAAPSAPESPASTPPVPESPASTPPAPASAMHPAGRSSS